MGKPAKAKRRTVSAAQLAYLNPTSTEDERRDYYQARLQFFAKIFFLLFVLLYAFVNTIFILYPQARPSRLETINWVSAGGLLAFAFVWLGMLRSRKPSLESLFRIDIAISITLGLVLGVNSYLSMDRASSVYSLFIYLMIMIFARTAIVPSSGRKTFMLATVAFTPIVIASIAIGVQGTFYFGIPSEAFVTGCVAYGSLTVLFATMGSQVIYGLRKQVLEARQLGQYTLLQRIGAGGMGEVYRAKHAMLRRPTALKLLPPETAGVDNIERFEREVQFTAELTHPNTIAIYDFGRSPNGVFYYVMEYLEGINLEQLVEQHGPQSAGRVIHILRQICGSLSEAHGRGLVHRDIKPANVHLCNRGDVPDLVKVLDFGLVKNIEGDSELTTGITGTPAYMSPEAVKSPSEIGPASDLYAVGALGYFLITGQNVFNAANVIEMCVQHVRSEPIPPSQRTDAPVPPALEAVLLQCLKKDPADRPASARALRDELSAIPEAADWNEAEASEWWREHGASKAPSEAEVAVALSDTLDAPMTIKVDMKGRTPLDY